MPYNHRIVVYFFCACAMVTQNGRCDWSTLYGSARAEARQISSSSLAVPLSPEEWKDTVARRREMWRAAPPTIADETAWLSYQQTAIRRLRELTFRTTQLDKAPRQRDFRADGNDGKGTSATYVFDSLDGMTIDIKTKRPMGARSAVPTLIQAEQPDARSTFASSSRPGIRNDLATATVEVRNTGATSVGPGYLWTARRTYPLLGQTLPERQVCDLLAATALLRRESVTGPIAMYGQGYTASLAIYATILDPQVTEIVLVDPPTSHEDPHTPEFLGVLRIGDLPQNLALVYPRTITFVGEMPEAYSWTRKLYEKCGAGDRVRIIGSIRDWQPQNAIPRL